MGKPRRGVADGVEPWDVLFLERSAAGMPFPSGYHVLLARNAASIVVSLLGQDAQGLCAAGPPQSVSIEDADAFVVTDERARPPERPDG